MAELSSKEKQEIDTMFTTIEKRTREVTRLMLESCGCTLPKNLKPYQISIKDSLIRTAGEDEAMMVFCGSDKGELVRDLKDKLKPASYGTAVTTAKSIFPLLKSLAEKFTDAPFTIDAHDKEGNLTPAAKELEEKGSSTSGLHENDKKHTGNEEGKHKSRDAMEAMIITVKDSLEMVIKAKNQTLINKMVEEHRKGTIQATSVINKMSALRGSGLAYKKGDMKNFANFSHSGVAKAAQTFSAIYNNKKLAIVPTNFEYTLAANTKLKQLTLTPSKMTSQLWNTIGDTTDRNLLAELISKEILSVPIFKPEELEIGCRLGADYLKDGLSSGLKAGESSIPLEGSEKVSSLTEQATLILHHNASSVLNHLSQDSEIDITAGKPLARDRHIIFEFDVPDAVYYLAGGTNVDGAKQTEIIQRFTVPLEKELQEFVNNVLKDRKIKTTLEDLGINPEVNVQCSNGTISCLLPPVIKDDNATITVEFNWGSSPINVEYTIKLKGLKDVSDAAIKAAEEAKKKKNNKK